MIYVCNTSSDYLSEIDLDKFIEKKKIVLNKRNDRRIGPHGICIYRDKIITANSYSNTISIIDRNEKIKTENYYIGVHCNDVRVCDNKAYVICGDLNNVVVFDLVSKNVLEQIPCGNCPHSIDINKSKKLILISNMQDDSITLIDCLDNKKIRKIRVGAYPTKAVFTADGNYALVCESNLGMDSRGCISVISLKNYKVINRIPVGNSPVDIFYNEELCYVSNFAEGTISVVNISKYIELKKIIVGGMPRGVIEYGDYIFVADNYNNLLIKLHSIKEEKQTIAIGGEPTGMILI